jgi:hypothetical protein
MCSVQIYVNIYACVCTIYIHLYEFMNMYVHATYNLYILMYMYITRIYMFRIAYNLVNMYRHVCAMFSDVRTVLPILVLVVRIPDIE